MRASEIFGEDAAVGSDDLFEMANLRERQTGIPGTIYISTRQASHGPRVKYFEDRPGEGVPSFSVSISTEPEVVENRLPDSVLSRMSPLVIEWGRLNQQQLLDFWEHGTSWYDEEVAGFKASLRKVGKRRQRR